VEFEVIDVSGWPVMSQEPGGAEPKDWLARPEDVARPAHDHLWLFKSVKLGTETGYRRRDDVAERLASALAHAIRLPAAQVEFARRGKLEGIISGNITPKGWELHSGDTRLSECPGYKSCSGDNRPKEREGHNLTNIATVLDGCGGPPGPLAGQRAFSVFAGYLVFDAWIANTDRHAINWAVLERNGHRRLAPSFDHGSALASGIDDVHLSKQDPLKFARSGMASRFENGRKQPLVDLALTAVKLVGTQAEEWLERVARFDRAQLDELLAAATRSMRLSDQRRTFLVTALQENQRRLTA